MSNEDQLKEFPGKVMTTTTEQEGVVLMQPLACIQSFEGKEIRVFEHNGEPWFPLADLAAAWGTDRKTPGNLIGRNKDLFKGMFLSDGDVTYHDVNERGLYLLMGKINAGRLKNPEAKAAMIRFQRWVPELIQQYRKGEIARSTPPVLENPLADSLNRHADIADILTARYGYKPEIARNLAMQAVVLEQGEPAIIYRGPALLPANDEEPAPQPAIGTGADPDFDKYFSLTKVSEYCGCTIDQARNILEKEKVLERSNNLWHLTRYGEEYGKTFTTYPMYPHRMIEKKTIRYNPAGVDLVRKHMAAEQSAGSI